MSAIWRKALVLVATFTLLLTISQAAFADQHFFDGGEECNTPATPQGVSAYIGTARYPVVYGNAASSAWSMLAVCGQAYDYIQVGWIVDPAYIGDSNAHYFFEWNNGSSTNFNRTVSVTGPATDTTHKYFVQNTSGAYWQGYVDNYALIGSLADSDISWTPNALEYLGEIGAPGTEPATDAQSPGETSDHVVFSSLQWTTDLNTWNQPAINEWYSSSTGSCSCQSLDNSNWGSGGYYDIWDNRY